MKRGDENESDWLRHPILITTDLDNEEAYKEETDGLHGRVRSAWQKLGHNRLFPGISLSR